MNQNFRLYLEAPEALSKGGGRRAPSTYDPELDDIRSVLSDICGALAETDGVRFHAEGFDDVPWRATVRTDLPITLEQIPHVLSGLKKETSVELDFFEQGLERSVRFEGTGSE